MLKSPGLWNCIQPGATQLSCVRCWALSFGTKRQCNAAIPKIAIARMITN